MSGIDTIRGTALDAMQANGMSAYIDRVGPVLSALQDREDSRDRGIAATILEAAFEAGVSRDVAWDTLEEAGLAMPVEDVASMNGDSEEAPAWFTTAMAGFSTRLSELEATARRARDRGLV